METHLADFMRGTADGIEAEAILRRCVHCGFCTATCPTYQLLGDELDSPRGRIYLIKDVLEGAPATPSVRLHLDRCLTCRNCETTCPSGVEYGRLVDIGRKVVEERATEPRPLRERLERTALREGLTRRWLFDPAMKIGKLVRPALPDALASKVPSRRAKTTGFRPRKHSRRMLMLAGCVQPAMAPQINEATMRVLDVLGVETVVARKAGCCGAIRQHLSAQDAAKDDMRRNIDAWWPHLEAGAECIVMNASGCGAMVKEYGHGLRDDPAYAEKAARVSALTLDLSEVLLPFTDFLITRLSRIAAHRVAWHPPCTLQHGQQIRGPVETLLRAAGVDVQLCADSHLCCGSAGTYSVLQPELSKALRDRKVANLEALQPDAIVSANIGCITHLQDGTSKRVLHWIELLAHALPPDEPKRGQSTGESRRGRQTKPIRDPAGPL